MSAISIIGSGTMATAVAGRIANAGHTVEVVNSDAAVVADFGDALGGKVIIDLAKNGAGSRNIAVNVEIG
ncbi:NAD(P)-binding domain-containing protein [Rhizobium sp. SG570]|uniref:NAD(P)-binding domain-containing protein n=1 Tax=Rhizobium sp. SG570 TaxID=2587113 RepID=UPI0017D18E44|nr:NAD(P)-binding domain-containing protein [Rhizobium sp. SG570]NKJ36603.1 3-hydroxyisobutyrate dehydrogenase-like beta-hydroxyacid dehydrogenase [Rhizobium sp. SG570]NRP89992.1 hypothetical protein [Ensifer adhaerens]